MLGLLQFSLKGMVSWSPVAGSSLSWYRRRTQRPSLIWHSDHTVQGSSLQDPGSGESELGQGIHRSQHTKLTQAANPAARCSSLQQTQKEHHNSKKSILSDRNVKSKKYGKYHKSASQILFRITKKLVYIVIASEKSQGANKTLTWASFDDY